MTPPHPYLATVEAIREIRRDLSDLPRIVRLGEWESARQIVNEARVQLAELLSELTPGVIAPADVPAALLEPPLTRPGGRPGEPPSDFAEPPLW